MLVGLVFFLSFRLLLVTLCDLDTLAIKLDSGCSVHLQRHSGEKNLSLFGFLRGLT